MAVAHPKGTPQNRLRNLQGPCRKRAAFGSKWLEFQDSNGGRSARPGALPSECFPPGWGPTSSSLLVAAAPWPSASLSAVTVSSAQGPTGTVHTQPLDGDTAGLGGGTLGPGRSLSGNSLHGTLKGQDGSGSGEASAQPAGEGASGPCTWVSSVESGWVSFLSLPMRGAEGRGSRPAAWLFLEGVAWTEPLGQGVAGFCGGRGGAPGWRNRDSGCQCSPEEGRPGGAEPRECPWVWGPSVPHCGIRPSALNPQSLMWVGAASPGWPGVLPPRAPGR